MAITKLEHELIAPVSNAGASFKRSSALDLTTSYGGIITFRMDNGATGPTIACSFNILIAHNSTTPTAGGAGTDWKTLASYSGGTAANLVTADSHIIGPEVMGLCVEFTGNTGQAVTVESYFSEIVTPI